MEIVTLSKTILQGVKKMLSTCFCLQAKCEFVFPCLLDIGTNMLELIHLHIFLNKQYNMLVVSVLSNLPTGQVELNELYCIVL